MNNEVNQDRRAMRLMTAVRMVCGLAIAGVAVLHQKEVSATLLEVEMAIVAFFNATWWIAAGVLAMEVAVAALTPRATYRAFAMRVEAAAWAIRGFHGQRQAFRQGGHGPASSALWAAMTAPGRYGASLRRQGALERRRQRAAAKRATQPSAI